MARIRTIKPDFFKHEDLYDLEVETGLPVRVAFAGLWTCCDREGRFEWRPRALKTDILPYDEVDFSRVLDALTTRGFVQRYASNGKEYGCVPGFSRHQVINNREKPSDIPEPTQGIEKEQEVTPEPRVDHASTTREGSAQAEGEGKGKGRDRVTNVTLAHHDAPSFSEFWEACPCKLSKEGARKRWSQLPPQDRDAALLATRNGWFERWRAAYPDANQIHPPRFLAEKRWQDELPPPKNLKIVNGGQHGPTHSDPTLDAISLAAGMRRSPGANRN